MENDIWRKRLNFTIGLFILVAAILGYRLFQKQILEHSIYLASAENQYFIKKGK